MQWYEVRNEIGVTSGPCHSRREAMAEAEKMVLWYGYPTKVYRVEHTETEVAWMKGGRRCA